MGRQILVVSGIMFWVMVAGLFAWRMGLLPGIKFADGVLPAAKMVCGAGEELVTFQTGKSGCYKIPKDSGKTCTASGQCESGKCVTREPKAKVGSCYQSSIHLPCVSGFWTIEEAQSKSDVKKNADGSTALVMPFCVY